MTAFWKDLYAMLQTFETITEKVATRIYPIKLAENAELPAIVASRITTTPMYTHSGVSDLSSKFYQLRTWALTHEAADDLADIVEGILSGYNGGMGSRIMGAVFLLNRLDGYDPLTGMNSQILDFQFCES